MDQFTCRSSFVDKNKLEIDKTIVGLVLLTKLLWQINRSMKKITYSLPLGYRTAVSIRRLLNLITEKKSSKPYAWRKNQLKAFVEVFIIAFFISVFHTIKFFGHFFSVGYADGLFSQTRNHDFFLSQQLKRVIRLM